MEGSAAVSSLPTLVVDNGGGTVKIGWSTDTSPVVVLNAKAKPRGGERGVELTAEWWWKREAELGSHGLSFEGLCALWSSSAHHHCSFI